jgi:RNA polymerase sigma-70 factor (ECF subfamily)
LRVSTDPTASTDRTLKAAIAGDEPAFAALTERHRRELHVHCYRMLASFDEAEDAVQETFLNAWRGRSGFDGGSHFRAWLYRIATVAANRMPAAAGYLRRQATASACRLPR